MKWDQFASDQADLQWERAKQRRLASKPKEMDITEQDLEKHREGDYRDLMTKIM